MMILVVLFGATATAMQREDKGASGMELRLRAPARQPTSQMQIKQPDYFSEVETNPCCVAMCLVGLLLPVTLGGGQ